jgi:nicotinamidase-related amidase
VNTALVLVDVQRGFQDLCWGPRNNPKAEEKIRQLLSVFRETSRPIIHVHHLSTEVNSPLRPGQIGVEPIEGGEPHFRERIFRKRVNSAFIGTGLEDYLRSVGIETLTMVGFTTDHCVSTSARMAANLGFRVAVAADATVAFARQGSKGLIDPDLVHEVSLASLRGEFAFIATSNEIITSLEAAQNLDGLFGSG